MQSLTFKLLFQRKGTISAIIAVALLVALVASVNGIVNNINAQTSAIAKLATAGEAYLITSKNSTCLTDSQINPLLINQFKNNSQIQYATCHQLSQANLSANSGQYSVTIRGVDDVAAFFGDRHAWVSGSVCKENQVNLGTILSKLTSINRGDLLNFSVNNQPLQLKVSGIVQSQEQSDSEIILPLSTLQNITQTTHASFIEFSVKDTSQANKTISSLTQILPSNVHIISLQQVGTFVEDVNNQTVAFIDLWSLAIYAVVVAASYVISTRIVNEAQYELSMLRMLGAKKKFVFNSVLFYTLSVAVVGSVVGVSLGVVGTQVGSSLLRWIGSGSLLAPFLEVNQALMILLLAFLASFIGCVYPALKGAQTLQELQQ
ncbi:MAG: FtsX-like permease family protein [Candidatus Bathyarchaeota archaeon]|nr:FtsX-like permease family protein [Candidatus Bathyarchaeota archaeon]